MPENGHEHEITIVIDHKKYETKAGELNGTQIRELAKPPIGSDYNLFLEVPGGEDKLIADSEKVKLKDEMTFFSIQKHITPGARC
jgi:hypothetical protein